MSTMQNSFMFCTGNYLTIIICNYVVLFVLTSDVDIPFHIVTINLVLNIFGQLDTLVFFCFFNYAETQRL